MTLLDDLLADLSAEGDALRAVVADLDDAGWRTPTPAEGWDVATQIAHLLWTDETAATAAGSLEDKAPWDALVLLAIEDPAGFVDAEAFRVAKQSPDELLSQWDTSRTTLQEALRALPDGAKMPWFGPPMSAASMATARFMESWAHGLDVREGLGLPDDPTDRMKHVAHIGVRTRNFSFAAHELPPPDDEFRIELSSPSGEVWTWGPDDAAQRVTGSAYDFCRLVTQRIHRNDTDLTAIGADAEHWLAIAQAFAGPPGKGRAPR